MSTDADSLYSSYREKVIEHLFVGDVLRRLWLAGIRQVEVLRSETDAAGYDVVFECSSASRHVIRHIQLKATRKDGRRAHVGVNVELEKKPSGCVVWVYFDSDMNLGPFLWFGEPPGKPLSLVDKRTGKEFKKGKHTKHDATGRFGERPKIREVPKSNFERVNSIQQLIVRLFDDIGQTREVSLDSNLKQTFHTHNHSEAKTSEVKG